MTTPGVQQGASPKPAHFQTNHTPTSTTASGGVAETPSSIASWGPVRTVRESTIWSWITWPFTATASFFKGLWTRISTRVWGIPQVVNGVIKVEVGGVIREESIERAVRHRWCKYEEAKARGEYICEGVKKIGLTDDQMKIEGYIPIEIPNRRFSGYIWRTLTTTVRHAIEHGDLTVKEALDEKYFEQRHVDNATWLKKEEPATKQ